MRNSARLTLCLLLTACHSGARPLLGTLEWDRATVAAEVSEPIVAVAVKEGDAVVEGQEILRLDARRSEAQSAQAQAEVRRLEANLAELRHGARQETVDAQRAALTRAEATLANAQTEAIRDRSLRRDGGVSQETMEASDTALRTARADAANQRAQLDQLLHGTRPEDLDMAEAQLAGARATAEHLALTLERLTVRAPRPGKVDALPYRLGDQPPHGATLVSLLVGDAPYARVFVPESQRARIQPGTRFRVTVDGVNQPFAATLRSIRSRYDFTPYYALTGDDASRLSFRAELLLSGEAARQLPAGVPLQAELQ
jgi:HlyD family secretion protein